MRVKTENPLIFVDFENLKEKPFIATFKEEGDFLCGEGNRYFWLDLLELGIGVPEEGKRYNLTIELTYEETSPWEESYSDIMYEARIKHFEEV